MPKKANKKKPKKGNKSTVCPGCGSPDIEKRKARLFGLNLKFDAYTCNKCGLMDIFFPEVDKKKIKEFKNKIKRKEKEYHSKSEKKKRDNLLRLEHFSYIFLTLGGFASLIYYLKNPETEVLTLTVFIWMIFAVNFVLIHSYNKMHE